MSLTSTRTCAMALGLSLLSGCNPVAGSHASTAASPFLAQASNTRTAAAAPSSAPGPLRQPVTLDNPSGAVRCHYSQTVAHPQGLDVRAAPDAGAAVLAHLPQDWTVFGCTVSTDQMWLGIVHEHGLPAIEDCPADDAHCALSWQCALTVAQTVAGQAYAGPCHSGWIAVGHTFSLSD
ncbi:hypothetical protein [Stenotrophomonas ginsengisoli]|uniref:hypothetical protein n=1 Tax=Stenotrophomonas ginsengisoli TaxID=336566 RepID=UPI000ABE13DD|nr:hypothetical protein [Stenotrophomonas ginsengisoli]